MNRIATIRIVACLTLACLIEGWLVAGSACASCGDYVMVGGHDEHGMSSARNSADGGKQKPPCQGPNCSQRSAPWPSQPFSLTPVQNDWGLANEDVITLRAEFVGDVRLEPRPATILRPSPIFRPPRQS